MKLFSWSGLVLVLSLVFIWSCGYWLWQQNGSWHLQQQKTELTQQLDKADALLQDWQRGYQLHLSYLQTALAPAIESTAVLDPLQELDERIRRILWPDPLLAYVVLDSDGKVLRFSSSQARQLFSQTRFSVTSQPRFLPPLVLPKLWVLPLQVQQNNQQLLLWFDAASLQSQFQQLMAAGGSAGELLLLDTEAMLYSRSRYQKSLLPRLGLEALDEQQQLQLFARRPPEYLLLSRQKYQDAGAWPDSAVVQAIKQRREGMLLSPYPNYLGRKTLAAWRWLPGWQLYLVSEQDANLMLQPLKRLKQQLLAALTALTALLLLMFWYLNRYLSRRQQAAMVTLAEQQAWLESGFEPPVTGDLSTVLVEDEPVSDLAESLHTVQAHQPETAAVEASLPLQQTAETQDAEPPESAQARLPAANALLKAWLQQPDNDRLAELSRTFLQSQPQDDAGLDAVYACELPTELPQLIRQLMQHDTQLDCLLELNIEVPAVVLLAKQALFRAIELWLTLTRQRIGAQPCQLRLLVAANHQLRLELLDQGDALTDSQWLNLLEPSSVLNAGQSDDYQQLQQLLPLFQAHISGRSEPAQGNKQVLEFHYELPEPTILTQSAPQLSGRVMLLCPPGPSRQLYNRMLRQLGYDLLPMDDASQLVAWCHDAAAQLDQLVIDESFAGTDQTLLAKIATVVRRYFPQVRVLFCVRQPTQWQLAQQGIQLLAKPVVLSQLALALSADGEGEICVPRPTLWLYQPDPLLLWYLEQQMLNLPYQLRVVRHWPQLEGDAPHDLYCLPWSLHLQLPSNDKPVFLLWYGEQPKEEIVWANTCCYWQISSGAATLSLQLYQLRAQQLQAATGNIADESTV